MPLPSLGPALANLVCNECSRPWYIANGDFVLAGLCEETCETLSSGFVSGFTYSERGHAAYGCQLVNCTLVDNGLPLDGIEVAISCLITNSIVWDTSGVAPTTLQSQVSYSLIPGGASGPGNIDTPPRFRDPLGPDGIPGTGDEDYRLAPGSPAIDAGDNTAVGVGVITDLTGRPRFRDDERTPDTGIGPAPVVDMGAYEFQPCLRSVVGPPRPGGTVNL